MGGENDDQSSLIRGFDDGCDAVEVRLTVATPHRGADGKSHGVHVPALLNDLEGEGGHGADGVKVGRGGEERFQAGHAHAAQQKFFSGGVDNRVAFDVQRERRDVGGRGVRGEGQRDGEDDCGSTKKHEHPEEMSLVYLDAC